MQTLEQLIKKSNVVTRRGTDANNIKGTAVFSRSSNINKRYFLEKRWSDGNKILVAIMMNSSKASEVMNDDTVNQLINQARSNGYDALYVLNLSAKIEGTSKKLKMSAFDFDCLNYSFIKAACESTNGDIFIGWGLKGQKGLRRQLKNKDVLKELLLKYSTRYVCYEMKTSKAKNNPLNYVVHPRPIFNKQKYVNTPFQSISINNLLPQ